MQIILGNTEYKLFCTKENNKIIIKGISKDNKIIILNKKEI